MMMAETVIKNPRFVGKVNDSKPFWGEEPTYAFRAAVGGFFESDKYPRHEYSETDLRKQYPWLHAVEFNNKEELVCGWDWDRLSDVPDMFLLASHEAFSKHRGLEIKSSVVATVIAKGVELIMNEKIPEQEVKEKLRLEGGGLLLQDKVDDWESITSAFRDLLAKKESPIVADMFVQDYSTSSSIDVVANNIMCMGAYGNKYDYCYSTLCGIPMIKLIGTTEDWEKIRYRIIRFGLEHPDFEWWVKRVVMLLDRCIETTKAESITEELFEFWNSWYKWQNRSGGATITGHIVSLYPFIKMRQNPELVSMKDRKQLNTHALPPVVIGKTDLAYETLGNSMEGGCMLTLYGGLMGLCQSDDGEYIYPTNGYVVMESGNSFE